MDRRPARARITRWGGVAGLLALLLGGLALRGPSPAAATEVAFAAQPLASDQLDGEGLAILQVGDRVYVGGMFGQVRSPSGAPLAARANLAAFDATTGRLLTTFRADVDGPVRTLATDGVRLFVGGSFRHVNGIGRDRLAAVDLQTGAVATSWVADVNSNVYGLAISGDRLLVVGSFSWIGGQERNRVAAVATSTGAVGSFAVQVDATVNAVAVTPDTSRIYLGGSFTTVNGAPAKWFASVEASTKLLSPLQPTDVRGPAGPIVVSADGTRVVAAVQGQGNAGTTWRVSDGTRLWRQYCDGDAQAVDLVGDRLFTGFHEGCEGDTTVRLTANDAVTGARDLGFAPAFDRYWGVRAIDGTPERLAVAGDFTTIAGVAVQGFALFPSLHAPPPPTTTTTVAPTSTSTTRPPATTTTTTRPPVTTTTVAPTTTTTTAPPLATTDFPFGLRSTWRYLADGSVPPAAWTSPAFADAAWRQGPGQLGYGDGDEATIATPADQGTSHPLTTYYRRTFTLGSRPATLQLQLVADDGAVVYLNGVEVLRDGLPAGSIGPGTYALTNRSAPVESAARTFTVPASALVVGTNVLAVEVHQNYRASNDLSFDAALS